MAAMMLLSVAKKLVDEKAEMWVAVTVEQMVGRLAAELVGRSAGE